MCVPEELVQFETNAAENCMISSGGNCNLKWEFLKFELDKEKRNISTGCRRRGK